MGMYNTIHVPCPKCGGDIEFQSKSGSRELRDFTISACPPDEIGGILGDIEPCGNCGYFVKIMTDGEPNPNDFSYLID